MRHAVVRTAVPVSAPRVSRLSAESRFLAYTMIAAAVPVAVVRLMQALIAAIDG